MSLFSLFFKNKLMDTSHINEEEKKGINSSMVDSSKEFKDNKELKQSNNSKVKLNELSYVDSIIQNSTVESQIGKDQNEKEEIQKQNELLNHEKVNLF